MHGGKAPQVIQAAQIRAATMEAHEHAQRMITRAGLQAHPIEHLVDSLQIAAAQICVWGAMVADLDNAGEVGLQDTPGRQRGYAVRTWVPPEYEEVNGERILIRKGYVKTEVDPLLVEGRDVVHLHPFVVEYRWWVKERADLAKKCLDAGIDERKATVAEQQGAEMVRETLEVIESKELGLTAAQRMAARKLVADRLRARKAG